VSVERMLEGVGAAKLASYVNCERGLGWDGGGGRSDFNVMTKFPGASSGRSMGCMVTLSV
jgi:hypothetical protein